MDTGIDKEQIEALKAFAKRTAADPIQLRFFVSLTLLVIGYFAVASPMADRLAAARADRKDAEKTENLANQVVHFTTQIDSITPRLTAEEDIIDWQNYVLRKLDEAGVHLHSFEPKKTEGKGAFKVVGMEVLMRGQDYEAMVDFIDRMEHGERIVRVEKVLIERQVSSIQMTVALRGLVKPGLKGGSSDDAEDDDAEGDDDSAPEGGGGAPSDEGSTDGTTGAAGSPTTDAPGEAEAGEPSATDPFEDESEASSDAPSGGEEVSGGV